MLELIQEHFQTGLIAFILATGLIQISPIKINPWSYLFKALGKALNGDLLKEVKTVNDKLDRHIKVEEEEAVRQTRCRILKYNGELINGAKLTKESWDELLYDVDSYEHYCNEHRDYVNNKANSAMANIKNRYNTALLNNDFL